VGTVYRTGLTPSARRGWGDVLIGHAAARFPVLPEPDPPLIDAVPNVQDLPLRVATRYRDRLGARPVPAVHPLV
jgi:hypothetical protein